MILRVIVLSVLLFLVIRALRLLIGGLADGARGAPRRPAQATPMKLVRDPVCGTHVMPRKALSVTADGTTHYFCSEECRSRFKA